MNAVRSTRSSSGGRTSPRLTRNWPPAMPLAGTWRCRRRAWGWRCCSPHRACPCCWPLDWKKLKLPEGRGQFEFLQKLIRLRREHPALRSDGIEYYADDFVRFKVIRYKRWDGKGDVAVVAANFDSVTHTIGLGFPHDGLWVDELTGRRFQINGYWRDFQLPAWNALVLLPIDRPQS